MLGLCATSYGSLNQLLYLNWVKLNSYKPQFIRNRIQNQSYSLKTENNNKNKNKNNFTKTQSKNKNKKMNHQKKKIK